MTGLKTYRLILNGQNLEANHTGLFFNGVLIPSGLNNINLSGYIKTGDADLRYYPISDNPSGYLNTLSGVFGAIAQTGSGLINIITGLSGYSESNFYLKSNPQNYAQSGFISNISGILNDKNNQTGNLNYSLLVNASGALIGLINSASVGVSAINGISGLVNLIGAGNSFVSISGQTIIISGSGANSFVDLSGYITTGDSDLRYYPLNGNPSGYLNTAGVSGSFLGISDDPNISNPFGSNAGRYFVTNLFGNNKTITLTGSERQSSLTNGGVLIKDFNDFGAYTFIQGGFNPFGFSFFTGNTSDLDIAVASVRFNSTNGIFHIDVVANEFYDENVALNLKSRYISGNWSTNTNPFLPDHIVNLKFLTGVSGQLSNSSNSFNPSGYIKTGEADLRYYPISSNPNGYLTTGEANNLFVSTGEGDSRYVQRTQTGDLATTGFIAQNYYSLTNPSGYITGLNTGDFISNAQTGQFYPVSNPQNYAQSGFVTGISGALNNIILLQSGKVVSINGLSGELNLIGTGATFITTNGQTILISGSGVDLSSYINSGYIAANFLPISSQPNVPNPLGTVYFTSNLRSYEKTILLSGDDSSLSRSIDIGYDHLNYISVDPIDGPVPFVSLATNPFSFTLQTGESSINIAVKSEIDFYNKYLISEAGAFEYSPESIKLDWQNLILSGNWKTNTSVLEDFSLINLSSLKNASGQLAAQISASNAGVGSLNGLSGQVNLSGAGGIVLSSIGQTIIVSGSGSSNINLVQGTGIYITNNNGTYTINATGGNSAGGGTKTYSKFTALDNQPPTGNIFATFDTRNGIAVLDFDSVVQEEAIFVDIMPEGANLGSGLIVRIIWAASTATSGDCRWGAQFMRLDSGTDIDNDSFDTAAEVTTTAPGTSGQTATTSITITTIDSISAGDAFRLKIYRDVSDSADTMTGDAELIAVEIRSAS